MIMDATQPLSDAFDTIWKAFSPTVNANKMVFYLWIIIDYYRDFLSTAVHNTYIRLTYEKLLSRNICNELLSLLIS